MERITVRVRTNLLNKLKTQAHIQSISLQEVVNNTLEKGLSDGKIDKMDDVFNEILKIRKKTKKGDIMELMKANKKEQK